MTRIHRKKKAVTSNFTLYCMATMATAAAITLELLAINTISASPSTKKSIIQTGSPALLISLGLVSIAVVAALMSRIPEPAPEQPIKKAATNRERFFNKSSLDSRPFYVNDREPSHDNDRYQHYRRGNKRESCVSSFNR